MFFPYRDKKEESGKGSRPSVTPHMVSVHAKVLLQP